jgi:hypothetical protein
MGTRKDRSFADTVIAAGPLFQKRPAESKAAVSDQHRLCSVPQAGEGRRMMLRGAVAYTPLVIPPSRWRERFAIRLGAAGI